jgi:hypothetical protein
MDDIITFDNAAARREMRLRHARIGRLALDIAEAALLELKAKLESGQHLDMSIDDAIRLRDLGRGMLERSASGGKEPDGGAQIKKPN